MIDWDALAAYTRDEAKRMADEVGLSDEDFRAVVDAPRPYPTIFDYRRLVQWSMTGGVPLNATDEQIEARILEVCEAARKDLAERGIIAPYSAPPLPDNFPPQFYGDYLKIARYSDDGLRIVVQTVLDVDNKPWYIVVRTDAFGQPALACNEKTA